MIMLIVVYGFCFIFSLVVVCIIIVCLLGRELVLRLRLASALIWLAMFYMLNTGFDDEISLSLFPN